MENDSKPEVVERWAVAHARANREHRTVESIGLPAECVTCGAKSPAWYLVESYMVERRGVEWTAR